MEDHFQMTKLLKEEFGDVDMRNNNAVVMDNHCSYRVNNLMMIVVLELLNLLLDCLAAECH